MVFFLLSKPYYTEWIRYNVSAISLHSDVFWTHIKRYEQVYILQIISSRNKKNPNQLNIGFVKEFCFSDRKKILLVIKTGSFFSCSSAHKTGMSLTTEYKNPFT